MKAMQISNYGKDEILQEKEIPEPKLLPEDILVEVYAASVNPVDYKLRDGSLKRVRPQTFPLTLGNDFAGIVVKVGTNVTRFSVGDRVYGAASEDRWGTFAEYFVIGQQYAAKMPQNTSFEEAAALPLTGLTAYQALTKWLEIKPGQKVFIPGGAGGVGVLAIPMAKALGAFVATTGSQRGEALIADLGADVFINYEQEKFQAILADYDAVFDTRGGEELLTAFTILKKGGRIISIAGSPDAAFAGREGLPKPIQWLLRLSTRKLTKLEQAYQVSYDFFLKTASGQDLEIITEMVEKQQITPVIDRIFPLVQAQAAMEYLEQGHAKGKVILKVKEV